MAKLQTFEIPDDPVPAFQIDAAQLTDLTRCDEAIVKAKDAVCHCLKVLDATRDAKKQLVAGFKEPLKIQAENLKAAQEQLSALEARLMVLAAGPDLADSGG
jgi:hypothetical protein